MKMETIDYVVPTGIVALVLLVFASVACTVVHDLQKTASDDALKDRCVYSQVNADVYRLEYGCHVYLVNKNGGIVEHKP